MSHKRLLVFNPETDFALASGLAHYTAPAKIRLLRSRLAYLPALCGRRGDAILIPEPTDNFDEGMNVKSLPYRQLCIDKGIDALTPSQLRDCLRLDPDRFDEIVPWGWNRTIITELEELGVRRDLMPSKRRMDALRQLTHRRTSIVFNRELNTLTGLETPLPVELFSEDDAMEFMHRCPGCYFKSPWSSSGRGIMVGGMLNERLSREWIHGVIRRQRSVMAETPCLRVIDFATEWRCAGGKAEFIGYSLFKTTSGGSYTANVIDTQNALEAEIGHYSPIPMPTLLAVQKRVIEKCVAADYEGPLGIDGCASENGDFRPCLELNLRLTMGHLALTIPVAEERTIFNPLKGSVSI